MERRSVRRGLRCGSSAVASCASVTLLSLATAGFRDTVKEAPRLVPTYLHDLSRHREQSTSVKSSELPSAFLGDGQGDIPFTCSIGNATFVRLVAACFDKQPNVLSQYNCTCSCHIRSSPLACDVKCTGCLYGEPVNFPALSCNNCSKQSSSVSDPKWLCPQPAKSRLDVCTSACCKDVVNKCRDTIDLAVLHVDESSVELIDCLNNTAVENDCTAKISAKCNVGYAPLDGSLINLGLQVSDKDSAPKCTLATPNTTGGCIQGCPALGSAQFHTAEISATTEFNSPQTVSCVNGFRTVVNATSVVLTCTASANDAQGRWQAMPAGGCTVPEAQGCSGLNAAAPPCPYNGSISYHRICDSGFIYNFSEANSETITCTWHAGAAYPTTSAAPCVAAPDCDKLLADDGICRNTAASIAEASNLTFPECIHVGSWNQNGTYTGKIAFPCNITSDDDSLLQVDATISASIFSTKSEACFISLPDVEDQCTAKPATGLALAIWVGLVGGAGGLTLLGLLVLMRNGGCSKLDVVGRMAPEPTSPARQSSRS